MRSGAWLVSRLRAGTGEAAALAAPLGPSAVGLGAARDQADLLDAAARLAASGVRLLWAQPPMSRDGTLPPLGSANEERRGMLDAGVDALVPVLRRCRAQSVLLPLAWEGAGPDGPAKGKERERLVLGMCRHLDALSRRHPGLCFDLLPLESSAHGPGIDETGWILDEFPSVSLVMDTGRLVLRESLEQAEPERWWSLFAGRMRGLVATDTDGRARCDLLPGFGIADLRRFRGLLAKETPRLIPLGAGDSAMVIGAADDLVQEALR